VLISSDVKKFWIMETRRMEKSVKKVKFPIRLYLVVDRISPYNPWT
jgi:hypothetical protein